VQIVTAMAPANAELMNLRLVVVLIVLLSLLLVSLTTPRVLSACTPDMGYEGCRLGILSSTGL
jgi:hypothetical protein